MRDGYVALDPGVLVKLWQISASYLVIRMGAYDNSSDGAAVARFASSVIRRGLNEIAPPGRLTFGCFILDCSTFLQDQEEEK